MLFAQQAVIGTVGGVLAGGAAVFLLRRLPLPSAGLAPVLVTGVALAGYTASAALGGSGLLAAYLAGLIVGAAHVPHDPSSAASCRAPPGSRRSGCSCCSACS